MFDPCTAHHFLLKIIDEIGFGLDSLTSLAARLPCLNVIEADHDIGRYRPARPLARKLAAAAMAASLCAAMLGGSASAKIIKWNCTFPVVANPNGVSRGQDFRMLFALDDETGKATLMRDKGTVDVTVLAGDRALTFIERLPSGAIQTTTVDAGGHSVHSRHMMIGTGLVPSQSYGNCAAE